MSNDKNQPKDQDEKTPGMAGQPQNDLDMHSSKDAREPQGGQGAPTKDNKAGENSNHDQNNERSVDGRRDS